MDSHPGNGPIRSARSRRLCITLLAVAGILLGICWLQSRSLSSSKHTWRANAAALDRMRIDADHIRALRRTPQRASDRRRANDELLAQVDAALQAAGVPQDAWQDSVPQPPRRIPNEPYERLSTRLYFEDVTLSQIVRVGHNLIAADPTLALTAIRLSSGRVETQRDKEATPRWRAEFAVSYLVYVSQDD